MKHNLGIEASCLLRATHWHSHWHTAACYLYAALSCASLSMLLAVSCSPTASGAEPNLKSTSIIDLTHSFDDRTIYWPTEEGFQLDRGPAGETEQGYFYAANRFTSAEHGGTHIDAPYHFYRGGRTVDEIELTRLIGPGVCVDVSQKCAVDRDYLISVEDLVAWEERTGASLEDKIVLLRTDYGKRWPDRESYLGTTETGRVGVANLHFPGLDPTAAAWLITRRKIRAVGIDTASIDNGPSRDFSSHVRLFSDGVPALENVAALDKLPTHGFTVYALPIKIAGGTGGPCRVIAIVE